eukprot:Rhum_TRINITY_DN2563_c0_g1::Rhum_TRINITY_DN2563_c0_g1_i1::g.7542::m.7542
MLATCGGSGGRELARRYAVRMVPRRRVALAPAAPRRTLLAQLRGASAPPPRQQPSGSSSGGGSSGEASHEQVTKQVKQQIADQVAEQWRGLAARSKESTNFVAIAISAHKGMLWGAGLVVAIGAFLFLFREPLKNDTVKETADVAKRVMSEKKVQQEATAATKTIVSQILRDDPSLELLVALLRNLCQQPSTHESLQALILRLFKDPTTKEHTKQFVAQILADEWIQDKTVSLCNVALHQVMADEMMRAQFVDFLSQVLTTTMKDEHIQHNTGEALCNAAKRSFGLSPSPVSPRQEEVRLQEDNEDLRKALRTSRLNVAKLKARLVHDLPPQLVDEATKHDPIDPQ